MKYIYLFIKKIPSSKDVNYKYLYVCRVQTVGKMNGPGKVLE